MSLIETITESLTTDFAEFLAEKFGLDTNDVSDAVSNYLRLSPTHSLHNTPPHIVTMEKSQPIKAAKSGIKTCQFLITRGPRENKQCETHIRGNGIYCSKHKVRKSVQKQTVKK